MTDETKSTKGFDISRLSEPLLLDVPVLGKVRVDACTTDFLTWFKAGERDARWTDSQQFARAILTERTQRAGTETDLPISAQISQVSDEGFAIFNVTLMARIAPLWSLDFRVSAGEKDTDEDDGPAPNFLDHMRRYASGRTKANQALIEKAAGVFPHSRLFDQLDSVTKMLRGNDPVSRAMRIADEQQKLLWGAAGLHRAGRIGSISSELDKTIGGIVRGGVKPELSGLTSALKAATALDVPIKNARGAGSALLRTKIMRDSDAAHLAAIPTGLSRSVDDLAGLRGMMTGIPNLDRLTPTIGDTLARQHKDLWALHNRFESTIFSAKAFGLGLTASQIAELNGSIGNLSALAELNATRGLEKFFTPGFQSVAGLGLSGAVGPGLISDLLQSYDQQTSITGALFAVVVESAQIIGNPAASASEVRGALHSVLTALEVLRRYAKKEYEKVGLINTIGFIIAIFSLWLALNPDESSDKNMLKAAKETHQQLGSISHEITADVERSAKSQIRYVHAASPLRSAPGREGLLLRKVYPDQWLRVLEIKGDWAHVEIYDYQYDASRSGWIHRSHLRRQAI